MLRWGRVTYYAVRAEQMRTIAESTRDAASRRRLLQIADLWDDMARIEKKAQADPATSDEPKMRSPVYEAGSCASDRRVLKLQVREVLEHAAIGRRYVARQRYGGVPARWSR
jgi:hypothetical protein